MKKKMRNSSEMISWQYLGGKSDLPCVIKTKISLSFYLQGYADAIQHIISSISFTQLQLLTGIICWIWINIYPEYHRLLLVDQSTCVSISKPKCTRALARLNALGGWLRTNRHGSERHTNTVSITFQWNSAASHKLSDICLNSRDPIISKLTDTLVLS